MPNLLRTARVGLLGSEPGNVEPGGVGLLVTGTVPQGETYPLIAHLYTQGGVFKKLLGKLLTVPTISAQLNGGQAPITLDLPAADTTANRPVQGDLVKLTQGGGPDGAVIYTGIIEDMPDDLDTNMRHAIDLAPLVAELDLAPITVNYTVNTDVAQMVRDAVGATTHLFVTPDSCPNSGTVGQANFNQVTALSVIDQARKIGGAYFYYFVDEIGCVWFDQANRPPTSYAVRALSNPVVTNGVAWEGTAVQEPAVIYDAGIFKMWYRGGWVPSGGMGYATSPDGVTWTKYASNPVIATAIQQPNVFKSGSTYHAYYMLSANLNHRTSTDGITWGAETTAVSPSGSITSWANSTVYQVTNLNWWMLLEGLTVAGRWETHLFQSLNGGTTWSHQNGGNPLKSLQVHPNGMYGGPDISPTQVNGLYQLWYHADNTGNGLPTDIYYATSPDLINWTFNPTPVLVHQGGWEYDQVADPSVVDVGGTRYMFYDGDNNVASTAAIGMIRLYTSGVPAATYTVKRGVDYQSRKYKSPIAKLKNHIPVNGGIAPGTSAPAFAQYHNPISIAQYGVRALFPAPTFPNIDDQATLTAIAACLGGGLDRRITRVELDINNFATRIQLKRGATLRYWEPDHNTDPESETGTGAYSPTYVVLETHQYGPNQRVVVSDIPVAGVDDFQSEIDRIMERTSLANLSYVPAALNVVGQVNGGGMQTSGPGTARWIIDGSSIRAEDGSGIDRGGGPNVTAKLGSDGSFFASNILLQTALSGARMKLDASVPIEQIIDGSGVVRAEFGNLGANGISAAGYMMRANDASGNPVFDSNGLINVMTTLASVLWAGTVITTNGTIQTVATTNTFTLSRPGTVLCMGTASAYVVGTSDGPMTIQLSSGAVSPQAPMTVRPGSDTSTLFLVASLPAGSYTAMWKHGGPAGSTYTYSGAANSNQLYVFQLGG